MGHPYDTGGLLHLLSRCPGCWTSLTSGGSRGQAISSGTLHLEYMNCLFHRHKCLASWRGNKGVVPQIPAPPGFLGAELSSQVTSLGPISKGGIFCSCPLLKRCQVSLSISLCRLVFALLMYLVSPSLLAVNGMGAKSTTCGLRDLASHPSFKDS